MQLTTNYGVIFLLTIWELNGSFSGSIARLLASVPFGTQGSICAIISVLAFVDSEATISSAACLPEIF